MFVIERWGDTPGAPRICVICEEQWTARSQEPRAFVGALYIGHICTTCETADPDVLLKRLEGPLADVREHLQQLEAVEQWALSASPRQRRRSFRVLAGGAHVR
jgi:hypothetical protein